MRLRHPLSLSLLLVTAAACAGTAPDRGEDDFVAVYLQRGEPVPEAERGALMDGHMANMRRLWERGVLLFAGPFEAHPDSDRRGLFWFDVADLDAARALADADPAVRAGALVYTAVPVRSSARVRTLLALERAAEAMRAAAGGGDAGMRKYVLVEAPRDQRAALLALGDRLLLVAALGGPREGELLAILDAEDLAAGERLRAEVGGTQWSAYEWWGSATILGLSGGG